MKCIYCGEELREGILYCPKCGNKVQIVPDYSIYEDDYLKQVLTEENPQSAPVQPDTGAEIKSEAKQPDTKKNKKMQRKIILAVAGVIFVLVFSLVILGAAIRSNHSNSVDYQISQAEKAAKAGNYEKAVSYYENALTLDKNNMSVRLALAELYEKTGDEDAALVLYQEVMRADKKNRRACEHLIAIYDKTDNISAILSLSQAVDAGLKDLFSDYQVTAPQFSLKDETFTEAQILQILSIDRDEIYYTMDGTDPEVNGILYSQPIKLEENNRQYEIKAVCKNNKGVYSDTITGKYKISFSAPDIPIVTPDGGDFGVETTVTITVPEGCYAYYTWDGSTPNRGSSRYTSPITVPEGNNILSVVLIDSKTNLSSDVYKGNFVYYSEDLDSNEEPEEEETIEE